MHLEPQENEISRLEAELTSETQRLLALRETVEKDNQARSATEKKMLNDTRTAKFFRDKLRQTDLIGMRKRLDNLKVQSIVAKRERVKELEKVLEEFQDLEPTDEALERKIEDLKKSRLSFDMSFLD